MENFLIVQYVELRSTQQSNKPAQIRSCPRYPPSSCTAAWPRCEARLDNCASRSQTESPGSANPRGAAQDAASSKKTCARNERPVRGDNRTGQAIWALGVDGRSRRIQPRWGGITAPTYIVSQQGRRTFKGPRNFFNFLRGVFLDRNRGFGAEFIARQRDWPRRRSTCPRPWRLPAGSGPVSEEPAVGPGHLLRRAPAKHRRPAPPVRR